MTTTPAQSSNPIAVGALVQGIVGLAISALAVGVLTAIIGAVALILGVTGRTRATTLV
jgi:hypothetical protein